MRIATQNPQSDPISVWIRSDPIRSESLADRIHIQQIKLKLLFSSSQVRSSTPVPPVAASVPTTAAPLPLLLSPLSSGSHIFSAPQPSSPPVNASSDPSTWSYINDHVHFHIGQWYA
ncbi:uncharacterized protein DS421_17g582180 [Arachis hypogaea]|nr:uncharacterized protein DS421_17g582180 [Arachis hypogaea]